MLAILVTHPIQYQVPIWKQLAERGNVSFEVWYLTAHGVQPSRDEQFGQVFKWDIDMLGGYPHRFPEPLPQKLGGFWDVGLPADFTTRLRSGKIQALFVQGWNVRAYWQAVFLAHHLGIQVWIRGDSNDLKSDTPLKAFAKQLFMHRFFRRVDKFLSIGKANARLYESYGVRPTQLRWAPHCVDNSRFAAQAGVQRPHRDALRKAWRISNNAYCVLFVGKFIAKKRPTDAIGALRLLASIDPARRYHVLFVGAGELGHELRRCCRVVFDGEANGATEVGLDATAPPATFAGFMNQSEISKAYVAADALVLPSDPNETWGLVVNEALASGLPCVVSKACGSAEDLVVPLDPQLTFAVGDQAALARAIMHLADHPLPPHKMAAHIAQYDFTATMDVLENLWLESIKT